MDDLLSSVNASDNVNNDSKWHRSVGSVDAILFIVQSLFAVTVMDKARPPTKGKDRKVHKNKRGILQREQFGCNSISQFHFLCLSSLLLPASRCSKQLRGKEMDSFERILMYWKLYPKRREAPPLSILRLPEICKEVCDVQQWSQSFRFKVSPVEYWVLFLQNKIIAKLFLCFKYTALFTSTGDQEPWSKQKQRVYGCFIVL